MITQCISHSRYKIGTQARCYITKLFSYTAATILLFSKQKHVTKLTQHPTCSLQPTEHLQHNSRCNCFQVANAIIIVTMPFVYTDLQRILPDGDLYLQRRSRERYIYGRDLYVEICPVTTVASETRMQFVAFFNAQDFLIYRQLSGCVIWDRVCHSKWKDCGWLFKKFR